MKKIYGMIALTMAVMLGMSACGGNISGSDRRVSGDGSNVIKLS